MSAQETPAQEPLRDSMQKLALEIYVQLCGRIYSASGTEKPQPKAVAQLSFKLAEAFDAANFEFNPVAIARRDAKAKATVNLADVEIDFAGLTKPK